MDVKGFMQRYEDELRVRGIPKMEFYSACGITTSAVSQWRTGVTSPTTKVIHRIAEYLNMDESYLVTGLTTADGVKLIGAEKEIIDIFRELDDAGKETVLYVAKSELQRTQTISRLILNSRRANLIPLRRSLQPVSAGRGAYLGPEEMEIVYVDDTPTTRRATFIVPVKGDSMNPLYNDGDQLLVERADDVEVGEIGVFTVNGDGYVKKRGENELISINPQYKPVPLTSDSWCNGRVIGTLRPENVK